MNTLLFELFREEGISRPARSLKMEKLRRFQFDHSSFPRALKQSRRVCFATDCPLPARARKPNRVLISLLKKGRQDKEKTENLNQTGIKRAG